MAVIDWYSRRVLSWRISNSMEAVFCVDCLEDALRVHGKPEVCNTDQGSQFTSEAFTGVLKREGVTIQAWTGEAERLTTFLSSGWGAASSTRTCTSRAIARWAKLLIGLTKYLAFYNGERPHQALRNLTPDVVHQRAEGGGAMIVNNYSVAQGLPIALRSTGTAFNEVRLDKTEIPKTKNRGSAVQLFVQPSAA